MWAHEFRINYSLCALPVFKHCHILNKVLPKRILPELNYGGLRPLFSIRLFKVML